MCKIKHILLLVLFFFTVIGKIDANITVTTATGGSAISADDSEVVVTYTNYYSYI
jgi:hypothetical protein